jgi:hypothetical protein
VFFFLLVDTIETSVLVMNVLFVRALARHLASKSVVVITPNPGLTNSELLRDFTGILKVVSAILVRILAFTTEQGSRALVWAAVGGQDLPYSELNGAYTNRASVNEVSDFVLSAQGKEAEDRLWVRFSFYISHPSDVSIRLKHSKYYPKWTLESQRLLHSALNNCIRSESDISPVHHGTRHTL